MVVNTPRYLQVADIIRRRINAGDYGPGDRIPTERQLRDEFAVSTPVARAAKAELEREGLVVSHQGKGSYVRVAQELVRLQNRWDEPGTAQPLDWSVRQLGRTLERTAEYRQVPASPAVADRLGITVGDMVTEVAYDWLVDHELVQLSVQWEPLALTRGTPIEVPPLAADDMRLVVDRFGSIGIIADEYVERTRTRMPSPDETRRFQLPRGIPVFSIERSHLAEGLPIETADVVLRGDRFAIETRGDPRKHLTSPPDR